MNWKDKEKPLQEEVSTDYSSTISNFQHRNIFIFLKNFRPVNAREKGVPHERGDPIS